jgi:hypothetical protein
MPADGVIDLEMDDASGLADTTVDTESATALSLALRWWQPFEPLRAFLHDRRWPRLRVLCFRCAADLDAKTLFAICSPSGARLEVLDLGTPVGESLLRALISGGALDGISALRLWDADLADDGVELLATVAPRLHELTLSGRSLPAAQARALTSACRKGASVTLVVHGSHDERGALLRTAAERAIELSLFELDAPRSLARCAPFEWLAPSEVLDIGLEDAFRARMFFEMEYSSHAASLALRLADPGVLFGRDLSVRFPEVRSLAFARADRKPLTVWDLASIAACKLPPALDRLVLHPHEWGWARDFPTAFGAVKSILEAPNASNALVELSELPETMNPGTYEQSRIDLGQLSSRLVWRC